MGEGMLQSFMTKLQKEYKIAFISTFIIAVLVHLYKFANTLPTHDSLYNYYTDQNVLGSGRWALSLACGMSSYYDLPWINGLMSCVFIALTVLVIVALFKVKNPVLIVLIGALVSASPATTETFFYLFTADGYMVAMFLAALAVYFSRMEKSGFWGMVLSAACICVSCGIYQAYVSFALLLALCYFIYELLLNNHSKKEYIKWVLRQAAVFIVSLAAYYAIWKLCMNISQTAASNYQGISNAGKISLGLIMGGISRAVRTTVLFFLQWNIFKQGLSLYSALNIIFLAAMAVGLLMACIKSGLFKRGYALVLLVLSLIALIPFACIWFFISDSVEYRAMMLQSLTLLFVLTALLYEKWTKIPAKNAMCLLLIVICINNAVLANISYFYMNLCYERSYAEGVELMCDIHDYQDEYEIKEIAIVGNRVADVHREAFDPETEKLTPAGKIQALNGFTNKSLLTDAEHTLPFLRNTFGMDIKSASNAKHAQLLESELVQSMACWPSEDSIAVIDGTLIIKFGVKGE